MNWWQEVKQEYKQNITIIMRVGYAILQPIEKKKKPIRNHENGQCTMNTLLPMQNRKNVRLSMIIPL
mgnify:CR=1 FL=1